MSKMYTLITKQVELILDKDSATEWEAYASISLNPHVSWMKLVLTDDKPNGNKQRLPKSEFANILKTGRYMPVKMAYNEMKDGHEDAFPLGILAHLMEKGDEIIALAALWDRERPKDIEYLKERYNSGKPIDFSWEITYTEAKASEEFEGTTDLMGVSMNAATIVGLPAYQGRTTAVSIASTEDTMEKENQAKLDELEAKVSELTNKNADLSAKLADASAKIEGLNESLKELDELKSFKASIEEEQKQVEKLNSIKERMSEAGIESASEYIEEKKELLLSLSDEQIDFFIQELAAFASKKEDDKEDGKASVISITSKKVPKINDTPNKEPKNMLEFLQTQLLSK